MYPNSTECEDDDALLNDSISEVEPDVMPPADGEELRLARIAEYRDEALRKEDCLQANLGACNAGLMEIASLSEAMVKNSLHAAAGNVVESAHVQRAMSTYLNVLRQIDRFANLDVRLNEAEQRADGAKFRRRPAGTPSPIGPNHRRH